jgi:hypothetical protein
VTHQLEAIVAEEDPIVHENAGYAEDAAVVVAVYRKPASNFAVTLSRRRSLS